MAIASAAPFSGLNLPANTAPEPTAGENEIRRVGMYGGRIARTGTTARHALAWWNETAATAGARSPPAAWRSAPATATSGGRWTVWTTGALTARARVTAAASNAWLWTTS